MHNLSERLRRFAPMMHSKQCLGAQRQPRRAAAASFDALSSRYARHGAAAIAKDGTDVAVELFVPRQPEGPEGAHRQGDAPLTMLLRADGSDDNKLRTLIATADELCGPGVHDDLLLHPWLARPTKEGGRPTLEWMFEGRPPDGAAAPVGYANFPVKERRKGHRKGGGRAQRSDAPFVTLRAREQSQHRAAAAAATSAAEGNVHEEVEAPSWDAASPLMEPPVGMRATDAAAARDELAREYLARVVEAGEWTKRSGTNLITDPPSQADGLAGQTTPSWQCSWLVWHLDRCSFAAILMARPTWPSRGRRSNRSEQDGRHYR